MSKNENVRGKPSHNSRNRRNNLWKGKEIILPKKKK